MRILALETDIETLKKKFLAEAEKAALVTHRHFFAFLVRIGWQLPASAVVLAILLFLIVQELLSPLLFALALFVWLIVTLHVIIAGIVAWKCNFVIVTTQKIVMVEQQSLFHQQITPIPFESISNTRTATQFFGIGGCGILYINMRIPEKGGEFTELSNPYMPSPEDISAVIENGLALSKKPLEEHEEKEKQVVMQQPALEAGNPKPEVLAQ